MQCYHECSRSITQKLMLLCERQRLCGLLICGLHVRKASRTMEGTGNDTNLFLLSQCPPCHGTFAARSTEAHQDGLCEVVAADTGCQERLDDLLVEICTQRREAIELHLMTVDTKVHSFELMAVSEWKVGG